MISAGDFRLPTKWKHQRSLASVAEFHSANGNSVSGILVLFVFN